LKALYVTDRAAVGDARFAKVLGALAGAEELSVQVRERTATDREALAWARRARAALGSETPLYVNRRFDVALAATADGVHLPADGLPPERVRANTPRGFRVGVSTHSAAEARAAIAARADLVAIGPIFDTPSKRAFGPPLGPDVLADLPPVSAHRTLVFAIGGISEDTLDALAPYRERISGIAAVRLFQEADDPRATARAVARR
jgi:thiamine-phosphate pyrophosphorylase